MAKLPINMSKAMNAWKEVSFYAEQTASIVLAGDSELVALAQSRFSLGGTVPATWVGSLLELAGMTGAAGEILLVLVKASEEAEPYSKKSVDKSHN